MNIIALFGACMVCIVDGMRRVLVEKRTRSTPLHTATTVQSTIREDAESKPLATLLFALSHRHRAENGFSGMPARSPPRRQSWTLAKPDRAFSRLPVMKTKIDPKLDLEAANNTELSTDLKSFMDELRTDWEWFASKFDDSVEKRAMECLEADACCTIDTIEELIGCLKEEENPNAELVETILRLEERLGKQSKDGGLIQAFQEPSVNTNRRKLIGLAILSLGDDILAVALAGGAGSKIPGVSKLARLLGKGDLDEIADAARLGDKIDDIAEVAAPAKKLVGKQWSKFRHPH